MATVTLWVSCFIENLIVVFYSNYTFLFLCLILLALCNWPNPFRHPHTKPHWLCRHYWHHHWPALDPSELFHHYWLSDNGGSFRRELANFSRNGGSIGWLLHHSWFGARRGLWHQYRHCYRRWAKRADHTHKANTSWWFNSFSPSVGRAWVFIWTAHKYKMCTSTFVHFFLWHCKPTFI